MRTIERFFDNLYPDSLQAAPWYMLMVKFTILEHPWVSACTTASRGTEYRLSKWVMAMGKSLGIMLMTSMLIYVVYPDDGQCEEESGTLLDTRERCEGKWALSDDSLGVHACKWNDSNDSCEYLPPQFSAMSILVVVGIVAILSAPVDKLIEYLVRRACTLVKDQLAQTNRVSPLINRTTYHRCVILIIFLIFRPKHYILTLFCLIPPLLCLLPVPSLPFPHIFLGLKSSFSSQFLSQIILFLTFFVSNHSFPHIFLPQIIHPS